MFGSHLVLSRNLLNEWIIITISCYNDGDDALATGLSVTVERGKVHKKSAPLKVN